MSDDRILNDRRRAVFLICFVIASVWAYRNREQIQAILGPFFEHIENYGPWAFVVGILAYALCCICLIPTTFLAPGFGWVFGATWGTLAATLGAVIGAGANYVIGHFLGRQWFERRTTQNHRFRAVEIACRTRGFQIVLLTRFTPVFPSNIMSYFFGVTKVKYTRFLLATAIGMLPRIVLYTTIGEAARQAAKSFSETSSSSGTSLHDQPWLMYSVVAITGVVFALLARIANRSLEQALSDIEATLPPDVPAEQSLEDAAPPISLPMKADSTEIA